MEFLKINKFAWILAIAFAIFIPKIAYWAYWDIFISQDNEVCEINNNNCDFVVSKYSTAWIAQIDEDEFYFIDTWNIIKKYNLNSNSSIEIWNSLPNTYAIAYRNWKIWIISWQNVYISDADSIDFQIVATWAYELWWIDFNTDWSWLFYHNQIGNWLMFVEIWQSPVYFKESSSNSFIKVLPSWNLYYYYNYYLYKVNEKWWDSEQLISAYNQNTFPFDINYDETYIYSSYYDWNNFRVYERNISNWDVREIYFAWQEYSWWINIFKQFIQPSPTAEIAINWLNCTTDIIPDIDNATWYNNFMNNTWFLSNVDDDWWIRFFSWSGTIYNFPEAQYVNRAALYYADQTAWWVFSSGSLNYPWTERTTIRWWNKSPLLLSFSDSEIKPNVVQWHGVNSVALWYAWTVQFQNTQLQDSPEVPISASGWIATAVISGNERINKVLLNYSSWFNWFRYWVAPTTSKSSCSYKYNLCEWSIEGANTVCQSWNLVWWIPAWNCVITGSWSVYGSWACVPETTASGAIIPPVIVPWVTVYDSEGNPVWNIYENESPVPDFSCWFLDSDNWLDTIGKSFKCAVSYIQNTFNVWKQGIDTIQGTSQTLWQSVDINPITSTWSATGAISNPLLAQLQWVDEWASETKYLKMTFWFFVFFFTILIVAVLATVLKWGIKKYFNQ